LTNGRTVDSLVPPIHGMSGMSGRSPSSGPQYAPEPNDIEVVWHDLKTYHLAHQTFTDTEALDAAIRAAVTELDAERRVHPLEGLRISA
jgi:hypothetical protein